MDALIATDPATLTAEDLAAAQRLYATLAGLLACLDAAGGADRVGEGVGTVPEPAG